MVPRHDDDAQNRHENQKALGGFGSRARLDITAAIIRAEPRLMKVWGFFIACSMIRKSWNRFSEKIMLKTKHHTRRTKCLTIP